MKDFNLKHFFLGCATALVCLVIYSHLNKPKTQEVASGEQVEIETVEYK